MKKLKDRNIDFNKLVKEMKECKTACIVMVKDRNEVETDMAIEFFGGFLEPDEVTHMVNEMLRHHNGPEEYLATLINGLLGNISSAIESH